MRANPAKRTYRVRGGVRWSEVIQALDPLGFSVAVMQSNHDFSVAGTLSVNAHGWPVPFGPFGSTVRGLRLMLADGTIGELLAHRQCRPVQPRDRWLWAVGDHPRRRARDVANVLLVPTFERVSAAEVAARLVTTVQDVSVNMAYGRLSITAKGFLQEALVVSYRPVLPQPRVLPLATRSNVYSFLSRQLYRNQIGSERGKEARWYAETVVFSRAPRVCRSRATPFSTIRSRRWPRPTRAAPTSCTSISFRPTASRFPRRLPRDHSVRATGAHKHHATLRRG
jgi:hypothetical protein